MAVFDAALPFILKHEGGWSNDPCDPGGATNYGITLNVFLGFGRDADLDGDGIPGDLDFDKDGDVDVEDLKHITPEMVGQIYCRNYWRFDGVKDQRVATKIFDIAVNMGLHASIRLVQNALNELGASLREDGIWGSKTEACVNAVSPDHMLTMLCFAARGRYLDIVAARPKSKKFLSGWLKRAAEIPSV